MRRNLGCLSIPTIFFVLITLLAITGVLYTSGGGMFSSGALSALSGGQTLGGVASHAELGGKCEACHSAPWSAESMADRCVDCHTQVRVELMSKDSLHGVFLQAQIPASVFQFSSIASLNIPSVPAQQGVTLKCNACHPDHRGEQAALVEVSLFDFPHDNLKFSLQAHQRKVDSSLFACSDCHAGKYSGPFDTMTCATCHFNIKPDFTKAHVLEFGMDCLTCHDGLDTYGSNFDHNLLPFKLAGKHAQTVCADCHPNAYSISALQSAPQDCYGCHQADDAHANSLSQDCAACHSLDGWKPAKFDHNLAAFKLEGKHIEVACEKCHVSGVQRGTPQDCFSCHQKNDQHKGQLGTDCAACHSAAGWAQINVNHSVFAFPLTGAHVALTCEVCHQNGVFKGTPMDCNSCHQKVEPHEGRFGADCAACHTTTAWKPATFDHNLSVFKLTGAHVSAACAGCHLNGVYKGTPQDCYACHQNKDKHNGQFGNNCASCHTTSTWSGASFDHNLSAFKLTGAHVNAACAGCHPNGVFKGTPQDCYACHQNKNKHNGQFGTNCASCHNTSTWSGASFDHNLSAFKLAGAHVNVACAGCHPNGVFKGTPQDCYACHRSNDQHQGSFGTNCASCHSVVTWKGATFNHSQSGFPLTGRHSNLACERCHAGGRYAGTPSACAACHGDPSFHSGMFGSNCGGCHSTSNWSASYNGSHPGIAGEGGRGVNHGHTSCRTCHTSSLHSATCTACHDGEGGGGGGGDD